jgi:hypothetical protein
MFYSLVLPQKGCRHFALALFVVYTLQVPKHYDVQTNGLINLCYLYRMFSTCWVVTDLWVWNSFVILIFNMAPQKILGFSQSHTS